MLNAEERCQKAMGLFSEGYNCAQSLVLTFADLCDVDEKMLCTLASPFGGGIARTRETCGAVSGAVMIIGLLRGYSNAETGQKKAQLYATTQEFIKKFTDEFGTTRCAKLLGKPDGKENPVPSSRNEHYFATRPCKQIVGTAAKMLAEYLNETHFCN